MTLTGYTCWPHAHACGAIPNSTLSTQDQVTNFQALYGQCDTVVGDLIIEYSDISDLTGLSGLPAINKVGSLTITENTILASLGGLESLVEIWDSMVVIYNPALRDCSALTTVLDAVDDGAAGPSADPGDPPDSPGLDFIWMEGNHDGCNSIKEILDGLILADGFEDPL